MMWMHVTRQLSGATADSVPSASESPRLALLDPDCSTPVCAWEYSIMQQAYMVCVCVCVCLVGWRRKLLQQ